MTKKDEPTVIDPNDPSYKGSDHFEDERHTSEQFSEMNGTGFRIMGCGPFGCFGGCLTSIILSILLTILLNFLFNLPF
ncbi:MULTISPECIES: hypothetical protein [Staphylococcus]|uniref:DUF4190 domain-containing protein n=1 Tax=Staphylococcus hsinchuensis TaxID=3051183 RepID=A0ABZ3E9E0_9STAP|nr:MULTISPECIES: hypothetical protein [unclassified Staphylococcus]